MAEVISGRMTVICLDSGEADALMDLLYADQIDAENGHPALDELYLALEVR